MPRRVNGSGLNHDMELILQSGIITREQIEDLQARFPSMNFYVPALNDEQLSKRIAREYQTSPSNAKELAMKYRISEQKVMTLLRYRTNLIKREAAVIPLFDKS